jgi:hypothetical protein
MGQVAVLYFSLVSGCLVFVVIPLNTRTSMKLAKRLWTDCTSTNSRVAPRRVRAQIRAAQLGSIRSPGLSAIAATQG